MSKFFSENIFDNKIIIDNEDVLHIKKVLRLNVGDFITVCDGKGTDYKAKIRSLSEKQIECDIVEKSVAQTEPDVTVTLFQGLPKATKMDYIIQKNTELGVCKIVPCTLTRCVVKIENQKAEQKKVERWQKISAEAAKQCGRGIIPEIAKPANIDETIAAMKQLDLAFVLYECEEN